MMKTETIEDNSLLVLKPFDIAKAQLEQLAKDYKNLIVTSETFEDAKKARLQIRDKRYEIQNILKDNKALLNKIKDSQEELAEELIAIIKPTEDQLDNGIKAIENKKAEEKAQKDREEKERIENRRKLLFSIGMTYNGTHFVLGSKSAGDLIVNNSTDEMFIRFVESVKEEAEKIESEKNETARKQKEENEKLALQKSEQERVAKEQSDKEAQLKSDQEKIAKEQTEKEANLKAEQEKIEAEKKALRKEKFLLRANKLKHVTIKDDQVNFPGGNVSSIDDLLKSSDENFEFFASSYNTSIEKQLAEKAEADKIKLEKEQKEAAELKAKKESDELARVEALKPDKEKLLKFAEDTLSSISMPEVKSGEAVRILAEVSGMITKAQEYIRKEVKAIN